MLAVATTIFDPLELACGAKISNRIAKAAMEENLAGPGQVPDEKLFKLYRRWSAGGAGLLITGNVMIDPRALTGPAGVVLEAHTPIAPFEAWAQAAKSGGAQVWMQISHPGRQVYAKLGMTSWSPSGVSLDMGGFSKMFEPPVAMTEAQIHETRDRFIASARQAERAGFDGVEIHAAHGYLLSQFLSPLGNRRTDAYGGSIENRARFLVEVVDGIRAAVRPSFALAVKLNSADFQRGGFDAGDARDVILMLNERDVDLVELSGGSYESPAMQGRTADERSLAREAYFLEFAIELMNVAKMPLMITGGITGRETAERVIGSGVSIAGIATALALQPDLPLQWRTAATRVSPPPALKTNSKSINALSAMAYVTRQLRHMGHGGDDAKRPSSALVSLVLTMARRRSAGRRYMAWLPKHLETPQESESAR